MQTNLYRIVILLALCISSESFARNYKTLNDDWLFMKLDNSSQELSRITLPHTFNANDADDGGSYYRGPTLYKKSFSNPCNKKQLLYIEFEAAAIRTEVFLNQTFIGRHDGAYTKFRFELPKEILTKVNNLEINVDNSAFDHIAPLGGDFSIFGGLYRGVKLLCASPIHFDLDDYGSNGIYLDSILNEDNSAKIRIRSRLSNHSKTDLSGLIQFDLIDGNGKKIAKTSQPFSLAENKTEEFKGEINVQNPHLWDGVKDPYLYTLKARILSAKGTQNDEIITSFGIKNIDINSKNGLKLNGKKYAVYGVNVHLSQRPGKGTAVSIDEEKEDFALLDELSPTGLRLAHYPHPSAIYNHADKRGYLIWSEVPMVAAVNSSSEFIENAKNQLRELIRQNYNHPSIFVWGLGNEIYKVDDTSNVVIETLQKVAKEEDPNRYTVYANCCGSVTQSIAMHADLSASNIYHGWYPQQQDDMSIWLKNAHALLNDRALAISEHGAGGSIKQQEDPPHKPKTDSFWHPEQYQSLVHEKNWNTLNAKDYLWGNFAWLAFDFASDGRSEGDRAGINDKGLVTYDRKTKKDAFFWYKANWSSEPVIYITSRRFTKRSSENANVKVYSNLDSIVLYLNGKQISEKNVEKRMASWDITLRKGINVIKAVSIEPNLTDIVEWELSPT